MKILIYQEALPGGHADIYRRLDYGNLYLDVKEYCDNVWTNSGNKIWFQGIVSLLSTEENELYFLEYINSYFDCIVYSTANLFYRFYKEEIEKKIKEFANSKIPIYVIAVGAHASLKDKPSDVSYGWESTIAGFMDTIYRTGGEIGVRGYFTKAVLDSVSSNSAVVCGCPSLFQNGRNLSVDNPKVAYCDFKAVINGNNLLNRKRLFQKAVFIDQDLLSKELYDYSEPESQAISEISERLIRKASVCGAQEFCEGKVELFMDTAEWRKFLMDNDISFSFGSRIHGNIISVLTGIPALLRPEDRRVMEMAELFHLPYTDRYPRDSKELYEMYLKTDYSEFESKYSGLYDAFEKFLIQCGLVKDRMNESKNVWKDVML